MSRHVRQTSIAGWLEAFGAHPRIGNAAALRAKLGSFADMSRDEQSATAGASDDVFQVSCFLPRLACLSFCRNTSNTAETKGPV